MNNAMSRFAMRFSAVALGSALCAQAALAQSATGNSVTLYGNVDQYLNYMRSSSGAHFTSLEDGAYLRSRFGFRGQEDLGGGYVAKFQLEAGLNGDTGGMADASRAFDRQSWVGVATPVGEWRLGRQNTVLFGRGGYIDFTSRTLGSIVNAFGVPSRYDNDISYQSPKFGGVSAEVHFSLPETPNAIARQAVYQGALDYSNDTIRLGYAGLRGRPPAGALYQKDVVYDNIFANWQYGSGTVYLTYARSNNSTSNTTSNNAATILGNTGGLLLGTNPDVNNMYRIYQISADYKVSAALRVGALWGRIEDTSANNRNADGGAIGAFYDMSKRTTLFAMVNTIRNDANAGFRPAGSGGLKTNFSGADANGQRMSGAQVGILHRF